MSVDEIDTILLIESTQQRILQQNYIQIDRDKLKQEQEILKFVKS